MREIGIGELRAKLSSVIKRVEGGERVRVTRRGRPVVDIVPVSPRVSPATRPLPMSPPAPRDTGRSASAFILAEREEER